MHAVLTHFLLEDSSPSLSFRFARFLLGFAITGLFCTGALATVEPSTDDSAGVDSMLFSVKPFKVDGNEREVFKGESGIIYLQSV
jgi:hypothetical protein